MAGDDADRLRPHAVLEHPRDALVPQIVRAERRQAGVLAQFVPRVAQPAARRRPRRVVGPARDAERKEIMLRPAETQLVRAAVALLDRPIGL